MNIKTHIHILLSAVAFFIAFLIISAVITGLIDILASPGYPEKTVEERRNEDMKALVDISIQNAASRNIIFVLKEAITHHKMLEAENGETNEICKKFAYLQDWKTLETDEKFTSVSCETAEWRIVTINASTIFPHMCQSFFEAVKEPENKKCINYNDFLVFFGSRLTSLEHSAQDYREKIEAEEKAKQPAEENQTEKPNENSQVETQNENNEEKQAEKSNENNANEENNLE